MSGLKKALMGIVFLALLAHMIRSTPLRNDPAARKIMEKCIRMYGNLKTYQEQLKVQISSKYQGPKIINVGGAVGNVIDICIARPNRLRFWQSGEFSIAGTSLVCDGKRIWEYMPMFNKFTNDEAPKTLKEIADSDDFMFDAQYTSMKNGFVIPMLFDPETAQKNLDNYPVAAFANEKETHSGNLLHIVLERKVEDDEWLVNLWIDSKTFLIHHVKEKKIQNIKMGGNALKHETVYEYFHNDIRINQPIPPGAFRFIPPPAAVETFNLFDSFPIHEKGPEPEEFMEGKAMPGIALPGMNRGDEYNLADIKGRAAVFFIFNGKNFDRSYNIGKHLQTLGKLVAEFSKRPVVFLGISMKSTREETATAIRKMGMNIPVAIDFHGSVGSAFHFNCISPPFWVIIDHSGVVKKIFVGNYSRQKQIMAHVLNSLL
ncbi:MAG: redoxin domain-containing protein [Candidatus Aminicenantes bacterium]|nr:redoxin domain-containing protein [Candidatus Aminicenantes bacterium]